MITIDDLKDYLGIDYSDAMIDRNLNKAVLAAKGYVKGALGSELVMYLTGGNATEDDTGRLVAVELAVAADFYDNRTFISDAKTKYSHTVRRMVDDFCMQLRLEMSHVVLDSE